MQSVTKYQDNSETNSSLKLGQRAIVIGGSMAGLLAGRVLSDYFEQVTIIERDRFPQEPVPRKGVPQSNHFHALLKKGKLILEQLFPGLENDLITGGVPVFDSTADIAWLTSAGWGIRFSSDLDVIAPSRPRLEWAVRQRLSAFKQVCFQEETEVKSLITNDNKSRVIGVLVHHNSSEQTHHEEQLYADLIVDASGRASHAPKWLEQLGYTPPEETIVNSFLGYASQLFQIPADFKGDWKSIYIQATPPDTTRGGVMSVVEGNRWMLTLGGGDKDYPPNEQVGFLEFARSLRSPVIYNAIKDAKPLSPIFTHRGTENRLRHYDHLSRWPENFVITGDAVCAFNPVYGQGMTTAALGALTLQECLRQYQAKGELIGMAQSFQKQLAQIITAPWTLATSEDYRYRSTEGGKADSVTRLMHWYMDKVLLLSTYNPKVRLVLMEVLNMLKPPTALFQPGIIIQSLLSPVISEFRKRLPHKAEGS